MRNSKCIGVPCDGESRAEAVTGGRSGFTRTTIRYGAGLLLGLLAVGLPVLAQSSNGAVPPCQLRVAVQRNVISTGGSGGMAQG
jgi:hypothetical protein